MSKKLENIAKQNVIQIMTRIVRDSISNTEQRFERVNFHNVIFGKTAIRNQLPNSIGLISKFHLLAFTNRGKHEYFSYRSSAASFGKY